MQGVSVLIILLSSLYQQVIALGTPKCTAEDIGLRFEVPYCCSKFLICFVNRTMSMRSCPEGLHFNGDTQLCDFPSRVQCTKEPLAVAEQCSACNCNVCCSSAVSSTATPADGTTTKLSTSVLFSVTDSTADDNNNLSTVCDCSTPPQVDTTTTIQDTGTTCDPSLDTADSKTLCPIFSTPETSKSSSEDSTPGGNGGSSTPIPNNQSSSPVTPEGSTTTDANNNGTTLGGSTSSQPGAQGSTTEGNNTGNESTTSTNNTDCPCCNQQNGAAIPVQGECQKFIICINDKGTVMSCPNNLQFNNVTRQCDYPENAKCPWESTPPSGGHVGPSGVYCAQGGRCIGQPDGTYYANATNACSSSYVICQCECEVPRKCSATLMFNAKLGVCDWPNNFGC